jgi:hypothetical protein
VFGGGGSLNLKLIRFCMRDAASSGGVEEIW